MKKTIYISSTILFLSAFWSCRKALKNPDDYYPKVSTSSAVVNTDGTAEVTANVESTEGGLEYIGFCMDTLPNPDMLKNQKIVREVNGNEFKTTFDMNFDPAKTYYFRSWAANQYGYSYGNVISLTGIKATPIEAPCTLNPNSSNVGLLGSGSGSSGSVYDVTAVDHFSSTWDITCSGYSSDAGRLRLSFGSALKTKVYTTIASDAYGDFVHISVTSGFISGIVNAGSKVYVNQKSPGVYEITICDAPWTIDGSSASVTLNARFTSPY